MLSSRQNHKSPGDMAPEPVGIFNKMRKSLSGKYFHKGGTDFSRSRGRSLSIPQMDSDTAIPYIRHSSFTKSCPVSCIPSAKSEEGHRASGQTSLSNGSMCMNGQLSNGSHSATDEDADTPAKQGSHPEPESQEVSVFERQGARPKIRQSSREDETSHAFDTSASEEPVKANPELLHSMESTKEPPCVEMAQPYFPVLETNCNACSLTPTPPVERRTEADSPAQMPSLTPGTVKPTIPPRPVLDAKACSVGAVAKSRAPMTKPHQLRTEIPPISQVANTHLKSVEIPKAKDSINVEGPNPLYQETLSPLYTSCPLPEEKWKRDEITASASSPPTHAGINKVLNTESQTLAVEQKGCTPADTLEGTTAASHQKMVTGEESETNCAATDPCSEHVEVTVEENAARENNLPAVGAIDSTMRVAIMDLVREALVENIGKHISGTQACTSEGSDDASKHCCTCTCDKSRSLDVTCHDTPTKPSLTLEGISQEGPGSAEGSPRPPRTPHIAMLVNSDGLFSVGDGKTKSLSEHDLHMMLKFNNYAPQPGCQDGSAEDAERKARESTGCNMSHSETTEAFGAMNISQAAANIPEEESHRDNFGDSQYVLGATGGLDSLSARGNAPRVDRSSKPKDLCEAAGEDSSAEEPPPLPPRLPAPPVRRPDPFAAYPIFDDDDDDFPTHEFLHDININLYVDPKDTIKSKSLPRNTAPSLPPASPPELQAAKRGKTVNMRNRFSQIFKPAGKKKRHSSHGFPDRPLPDIPLNPRLPKTNENSRQNDSTLFGTTSGDIVSQQALKEGLLKEVPSKEDVEKARELFAISLRKISEYGWYWGPMSWDDAESRLENMPDGSFLVRDSSDDRHLLSLSFRAQGSTHHTRVEHHNGKFSFWSQPCSHGSASIVEFVEEAMRHSHSGRVLYFLRPRMPGYPPAAVQLLYPISRFQKSRSLQHMCRFVIRKHVRLDHIDSLPLPGRLRKYLKEAQYYTQDDILH